MADYSQGGIKFNPNTDSKVQSPEQLLTYDRNIRLGTAAPCSGQGMLCPAGGWWVVNGNQCSDSRPVHPCVQLSCCPAPAAKHYFNIRNHNAE